MIEYSAPWTRQPQNPTSVNKKSILSQGLIGLWLPTNGGYFDCSQYKNHLFSVTGRPLFGYQRDIAGLGFTTSDKVIGGSSTPPFSAATGFSVALWARSETAAGSYDAWISRGASGPNDWVLGPGNAGVDFLYSRNGAELFLGGSASGTFPWRRFVLTVTSGGAASIYTDGVLQKTGSSIPIQTSGDNIWVNDRESGAVPGRGVIGPFAMWGKPLSAFEVALDYSERWQLFAPRRTWVPQAAAGGLPTLSASTYKPGTLTTTGWTARITAT